MLTTLTRDRPADRIARQPGDRASFGRLAVLLTLCGLAWTPASALPPVAAGAVAAGAAAMQHGGVHGAPSQSYLGVDVRDVPSGQVNVLHLKNTHGAEIVRVDHDGPAGKMGLHEHDVVLEMNGKGVSGQEQMRRMLRETPPGRMVVLLVSRDGQSLTLSSPMADRGQVERQAWVEHLTQPTAVSAGEVDAGDDHDGLIDEQGTAIAGRAPMPSKSFLSTLLASPTYTGAMLEVVSPQLAQFFGTSPKSSLLVRSVAANSPAESAGLHAGDVVTKVNFKAMTSVAAWTKMIKEAHGRPVTLSIMRDHQDKSITLIPDVKRR